MKIDFHNLKHQTLVNDYDTLCKKYNKKGQNLAVDILNTLNVLRAADTMQDIPRSYRPHPLHREYKGCFAVNVDDTRRIIFQPNRNVSDFRIGNYKTIKSISILEIFANYH